MSHYERHPRWITVRSKGSTCASCKCEICPGERLSSTPRDTCCCEGDNSDRGASRESSASAQNNTSI